MKRLVNWVFFPIMGFLSLVWFLVRVIPKPSRAAYPCMRATAPFASSFVIWIVGLFSSAVFFKKAKQYRMQSRHVLSVFASVAAIVLFSASILRDTDPAKAVPLTTSMEPNQPRGDGKGIYPGRVIWVHDPAATNENCQNTRWGNDYWYMDKNTDQAVVNQMVSDGIQRLTGTTSDSAAWDAIFRYYNNNHGKDDVGYKAGEKIVIKINLNGGGTNINTSPQLCHAVLNQLINVVKVAQADIGIGDPSHQMDNATWDKCSPDFPNVIYWRLRDGFSEKNPIVGSDGDVIFASDGGKSNQLPQSYLDAAYMINLPIFKKHHRAGISLCAKNHFGSVAYFNGNGANDWHYSLPCPEGGADVSNGEYGVYRCFVDIMAHKDLGGKTILYLMDGLWSSINWGHPPIKWRMAPFNNDYPNSLFFSEDPVAIESVGFDFLYYEFDENHPTEGAYDPRDDHGPFPHYAGVDDYLRQAADATNRPADFVYDPEKDGTPVPASLGVYEHWNNADEKKYSRNLGLNAGIELVLIEATSAVRNPDTEQASTIKGFKLEQNYPNPFNPSTSIRYQLDAPSQVSLAVFQVNGQLVRTLYSGNQSAGVHTLQWDGQTEDGLSAPSGVYLCRIVVQKEGGVSQQVRKMTLNR